MVTDKNSPQRLAAPSPGVKRLLGGRATAGAVDELRQSTRSVQLNRYTNLYAVLRG